MYAITVKEAAEKWGVTTRRVQDLCKQGRIPGAQRWERTWMIPRDALYPTEQTAHVESLPMPRKSPFLDMTDLYKTPGTADACIAALEGQPEAQQLFAAQIAYSRGQVDEVYNHMNFFLQAHSGFYAVLGGGLLMSLCAMWRGDLVLWQKARQHIQEAPCKTDADKDIVTMTVAAADSAIRHTEEYPDWFRRGRFGILPPDAHPAAGVYYVKYLLYVAQDVAMNKLYRENVNGMNLMRFLPYLIEPLITQAVTESTVLPEIYLRLLCATVYKDLGDLERAYEHIDKAIEKALPDGLLGVLAEHRRQLGSALDDRLALRDPNALKKLKELHKQLAAGWAKLHNAVLTRRISTALSPREREVAKLVAFGLTNPEIAQRLNLSVASVKSIITMIRNKTGIESRSELAHFI